MTKREEIARGINPHAWAEYDKLGNLSRPDVRMAVRETAKAADRVLSILREPDAAMVEAGMVFVDGYYDDDRRETAHDIFTAMINAADAARGEG
jgi:hypothetical protein